MIIALVLVASLSLGGGLVPSGAMLACSVFVAAFIAACATSPRLPPRVGTLVLLIALAAAAVSRGAAHRDQLERRRAWLPPGGDLFRLQARVCEPPVDAASEPAVIVAIEHAEPPLPRGTRLRLRCPAGTRIEWSDALTGLARIDRPDAPRNPGGFDGVRFAAANTLAGSGRLITCRVSHARGVFGWPRGTLGRWRTALERRLATRLTPRARAIVWPLVLGDRSELPGELGAELRVAGLVHLIALSGLHVVWLAELAGTFAAAAGAGVRGRAFASATCALVYLGLAGPIPSLARAAVSELLAASARLASRRLDPLQALGLSVVILLTAFPGWIADLGFQLSCTATLGLVTLGQWRPASPRAAAWLGGLIPTLGAQVVSMPLVLSSFHLFAWLAPAANLIAVPVAGWLLSAAWLALLADLVWPGLGKAWFSACDALCFAFEWIVAHTAAIPGAARAAGDDPALIALASVGAALLVWASAQRWPPAAPPRRTPPITAAALVGLSLCAAAVVLTAWGSERRPPPGSAWLVFLDVGQGDAIALGFPDGWWLVDTGAAAARFDAGEQIVLPFLRWAGVQRLEGLVITHDDSDHSGGAPAVRRGMGVRQIVVPAPLEGQPPPLERFKGRAVRAGARLHDQPTLEVLWPPVAGTPFTPPRGITLDNAGGVVLRFGDSTGVALLMADVDSSVEARIGIDAPVRVLKAGHHGSGSSTGEAFLQRVRPEHVVLSCGRRNRFGHPAPSTLARLATTQAVIERTDRSGALWFELTHTGVRRIDWQHAEFGTGEGEPSRVCTGAALAPRRP